MSEALARHHFPSRDALDARLADEVALRLGEAIASRGRAVLAVPGGTTPAHFFTLLSRKPLEWARITVTLTDERWVAQDSPDSNERLVRDKLLANAAASARLEALKRGLSSPAEDAEWCNRHLASLGKVDVIVLGMGEDGHTASLFPGNPTYTGCLFGKLDGDFLAVTADSKPARRITMSLTRILDAGHIFIHITGRTKLAVFEQARTNPHEDLPISAVLRRARTPLALYWSE